MGVNAGSDELLALDLADCVAGTRAEFARVFDPVCMAAHTSRYRDFKMLALGAATNRDAYARAWRAALDGDWALPLALNGVASNVIRPRAIELLKERPKTGQHPQAATAAAITTPQGYTKDMLPWLDPASFAHILLDASRRICRVEVDVDGTTECGTGFLVGPQTIITNWHVVYRLIDTETGDKRADSHRQLHCRFDYFDGAQAEVYGAPEDWLVEWSPMPPIAESKYPNMSGYGKGALDFAVIRLYGAPGRSRNWYDLSKAVSAPTGPHQPLFVLQHPAGYTLRVGIGDNTTVEGDQIRHRAPTAPGSSGGLCIDRNGQLVGLHRAEERNNDEFAFNIAVAAKAIAKAAPLASKADPRYEIAWRLRDGTPVIGRSRTCEILAGMQARPAEKPVLIIRGKFNFGKSFTHDLIRERVGSLSLWSASLKAGELPTQARHLAEVILREAGIPLEQRVLPTPDASTSTEIVWMGTDLMPAFREALRTASAARGGALLWLVIDELDESTLPETSARRFLDLVYRDIQQTPELRIVLLGLAGQLPAGDVDLAAEEDLIDPVTLPREAIENYLRCLSVAAAHGNGGKAATNEALALAARIALEAALGSAASPPNVYQALREFLQGPVAKALKKDEPHA